MLPNSGASRRYPGLVGQWYLYPVVVSLTPPAMELLGRDEHMWRTLDGILSSSPEPNVAVISLAG
jgi:hypothetical protein